VADNEQWEAQLSKLGWSQINIGVEGSAIPILGVTTNQFEHKFCGCNVSVVDKELNSDAILGLDFFEHNHCCINTEQRTLHLKGRALCLMQDPNSTNTKGTQVAKVLLQDQIILPPHSFMEVVARVTHPQLVDCSWSKI